MPSNAAVLNIIVSAQTGQATAALARVERQLKGTAASGAAAGKGVGRFEGMAKTAAVGGVAALAYGLYKSVRVGMDFEKQMSSLQAVTNASGRQMDRFSQQAMDMARGTIFGAREVAQAQTELAKAGMAPKQILGGGLKAALDLAAAGEMDLAQAANTTANALNLFRLPASKAGQVSDMLATAANTTTAEVSDFAMALTQGGSAAKQVGYSLNDTVVVLEALARAGIKNSDAGTSMKTALLQLAAPTQRQAQLARQLGLEFTNQAGEMKNPIQLAGELRDKLGDMTRAQRTAALKVLAGTDGFRTLASLYDLGAKQGQKLAQANREVGTASETAGKKTDNLSGDLERLQGTLESKGIKVYERLRPTLRQAAQGFDELLNSIEIPKIDIGKVLRSGGNPMAIAQQFGEDLGQDIGDGIHRGLFGSSLKKLQNDWRDLMSGQNAAAELSNGLRLSVKELGLLNKGMEDWAGLTEGQTKKIQDLAAKLPTQQLQRFFDAAKGDGVGKAVAQLRKIAGTKVAARIGVTGSADAVRELATVSRQAAKVGNQKRVVEILSSTDSAKAKIKQLQDYINKVKGKDVAFGARDQASPVIRAIKNEIAGVHDKTVTLTYVVRKVGDVSPFASGGRNLKEQVGLVGERGRELMRTDRGWTMLGEKGPHLAPIPSGADIFTAQETRRLLALGIPGFSKGLTNKQRAKREKARERKAAARDSRLLNLEANLAGAELTPQTTDDSTALNALIGYWQGVANKNKYANKIKNAVKRKKGLEKLLEANQALKSYQDQLKDLGAGSSTDANSDLANAWKDLATMNALRFAVSQAQYGVLKGGMPPFAGSFASGGVVPGPIGQPQVAVVHGGESIMPTSGRMEFVITNWRDGTGYLRSIAGQEVDKAGRSASRGVGRTPGNAGALV